MYQVLKNIGSELQTLNETEFMWLLLFAHWTLTKRDWIPWNSRALRNYTTNSHPKLDIPQSLILDVLTLIWNTKPNDPTESALIPTRNNLIIASGKLSPNGWALFTKLFTLLRKELSHD